jgi:hypothetical protein
VGVRPGPVNAFVGFPAVIFVFPPRDGLICFTQSTIHVHFLQPCSLYSLHLLIIMFIASLHCSILVLDTLTRLNPQCYWSLGPAARPAWERWERHGQLPTILQQFEIVLVAISSLDHAIRRGSTLGPSSQPCAILKDYERVTHAIMTKSCESGRHKTRDQITSALQHDTLGAAQQLSSKYHDPTPLLPSNGPFQTGCDRCIYFLPKTRRYSWSGQGW